MTDLITGNALDVLASFETGSVDGVVTDPPYFLPAQHYGGRRESVRRLADLSILEHFYRDVFAQLRRCTTQDAGVAVVCDGQSYPVFYALLYPQWGRLVDVVWDKGTFGLGSAIRRQHELILVGIPAGPRPIWLPSVLKHARPRGNDHPAAKPVGLMKQLVELTTRKDGLCLDPFAGSGSTGIAARSAGRRFVGIELDEEYANTARNVSTVAQPDLGLQGIDP